MGILDRSQLAQAGRRFWRSSIMGVGFLLGVTANVHRVRDLIVASVTDAVNVLGVHEYRFEAEIDRAVR